ncbi:unnamed protein product [Pleuronectes platessa]|uniref:Uncharacterized protein n=1 Tax=Pleuronectes platessa TaxID=8262 RepID=A0A9N7U3A1_PLEPL|nr:unnamed protein product [Pleuronectes platessa]
MAAPLAPGRSVVGRGAPFREALNPGASALRHRRRAADCETSGARGAGALGSSSPSPFHRTPLASLSIGRGTSAGRALRSQRVSRRQFWDLGPDLGVAGSRRLLGKASGCLSGAVEISGRVWEWMRGDMAPLRVQGLDRGSGLTLRCGEPSGSLHRLPDAMPWLTALSSPSRASRRCHLGCKTCSLTCYITPSTQAGEASVDGTRSRPGGADLQECGSIRGRCCDATLRFPSLPPGFVA